MKTTILIVGIVLAVIVAAGLIARSRASRPQPSPVVGGLYSTNPDEDGKVGIIKVLAVDREGVHVSMYKNRFPQRPSHIDESKLEFGTVHDPEPPGIMHVPLSNAAFTRLGAVLVQRSRVTPEELEPIKEWLGGGGYWP